MDLVAVRCAKCDSTLGTLVNLWTQIGKKYITPVAYVEDKAEADKIAATGAVRTGDAGTLVEGWYEASSASLVVSYCFVKCIANNDAPPGIVSFEMPNAQRATQTLAKSA